VLPQIGEFDEAGYTTEEWKMVHETQRILGNRAIGVTATCVRVPTLVGHAESVFVELTEHLSAEEARRILREARGVVVVDDPALSSYPMPIGVEGRDEVFVGRIREDTSCPNALNLWIVADNVRKGAALNAVQIAEALLLSGSDLVPRQPCPF
jgi:aspartate-semialdehyde dehydrogenase